MVPRPISGLLQMMTHFQPQGEVFKLPKIFYNLSFSFFIYMLKFRTKNSVIAETFKIVVI
jgi:hypothetical protein